MLGKSCGLVFIHWRIIWALKYTWELCRSASAAQSWKCLCTGEYYVGVLCTGELYGCLWTVGDICGWLCTGELCRYLYVGQLCGCLCTGNI